MDSKSATHSILSVGIQDSGFRNTFLQHSNNQHVNNMHKQNVHDTEQNVRAYIHHQEKNAQ